MLYAVFQLNMLKLNCSPSDRISLWEAKNTKHLIIMIIILIMLQHFKPPKYSNTSRPCVVASGTKHGKSICYFGVASII